MCFFFLASSAPTDAGAILRESSNKSQFIPSPKFKRSRDKTYETEGKTMEMSTNLPDSDSLCIPHFFDVPEEGFIALLTNITFLPLWSLIKRERY